MKSPYREWNFQKGCPVPGMGCPSSVWCSSKEVIVVCTDTPHAASTLPADRSFCGLMNDSHPSRSPASTHSGRFSKWAIEATSLNPRGPWCQENRSSMKGQVISRWEAMKSPARVDSATRLSPQDCCIAWIPCARHQPASTFQKLSTNRWLTTRK